jgi:hypothetical protein
MDPGGHLSDLVEALAGADERQLAERAAAGDPIPPIYRSGVTCGRGSESGEIRDVLAILRDGTGDSDELAAWRAAELRHLGVAAQVALEEVKPGGYWRALVLHPDGRLEDPTRFLPPAMAPPASDRRQLERLLCDVADAWTAVRTPELDGRLPHRLTDVLHEVERVTRRRRLRATSEAKGKP